jgi:hypothetical protein
MPGDIQRTTTPTTYNPQVNTFIKKPEIKLCPACGQPIHPEVKPLGNAMNKYVVAETGRVYAVLNDDAEELTIGGVPLFREDVYAKRNNKEAPKAPVNAAPILTANAPTTPVTVLNNKP